MLSSNRKHAKEVRLTLTALEEGISFNSECDRTFKTNNIPRWHQTEKGLYLSQAVNKNKMHNMQTITWSALAEYHIR